MDLYQIYLHVCKSYIILVHNTIHCLSRVYYSCECFTALKNPSKTSEHATIVLQSVCFFAITSVLIGSLCFAIYKKLDICFCLPNGIYVSTLLLMCNNNIMLNGDRYVKISYKIPQGAQQVQNYTQLFLCDAFLRYCHSTCVVALRPDCYTASLLCC